MIKASNRKFTVETLANRALGTPPFGTYPPDRRVFRFELLQQNKRPGHQRSAWRRFRPRAARLHIQTLLAGICVALPVLVTMPSS